MTRARGPVRIVPKGWGREVWIANGEHYCGKILEIQRGKNLVRLSESGNPELSRGKEKKAAFKNIVLGVVGISMLLLQGCGGSSSSSPHPTTALSNGNYHGLYDSRNYGTLLVRATVTWPQMTLNFAAKNATTGSVSGTFSNNGNVCFSGDEQYLGKALKFQLVNCRISGGKLTSMVSVTALPNASAAQNEATAPSAAIADQADTGSFDLNQPNTYFNQGGTVAGWPSYIAMGAVSGGQGAEDFTSIPVDAAFKYAGVNGNGDPGAIDPPYSSRMIPELQTIGQNNNHPIRVVMVEYPAVLSNVKNETGDFTNGPAPASSDSPYNTADYVMARHFASEAAEALWMYQNPVQFTDPNSGAQQNYYGSMIMAPDFFGTVEQNNEASTYDTALANVNINQAADEALCFMAYSGTYLNTYNPNGVTTAPYLNATYTGTPISIMHDMQVRDGYPAYSFDGATDPFWNTNQGATCSNASGAPNPCGVVEGWFKKCVSKVTAPGYVSPYGEPTFPQTVDGWVQAQNWLIRNFAPQGTVTFGWQDNIWAPGNGFWLHNVLTSDQIDTAFTTPLSTFLSTNAPSAVPAGPSGGVADTPDFIVFDRYERDDPYYVPATPTNPGAPGGSYATLYNAESWDNFLSAVGRFSSNYNSNYVKNPTNFNIPIMMWQIPGGHILNTTDQTYKPEIQAFSSEGTVGAYVYGTAPDYFFGDSNLTSNLNNLIPPMNPSSPDPGESVGSFPMPCTATAGGSGYFCTAFPTNPATYGQWLTSYSDAPSGGSDTSYDWSRDNGKLAAAASNNVFAILWGGGNSTNVIQNLSNNSDNGYLANKVAGYFENVQPVSTPTATPTP